MKEFGPRIAQKLSMELLKRLGTKNMAAREIRKAVSQDQLRLKTLGSQDVFAIRSLPIHTFLRVKLASSTSYNWYYYFNSILGRSNLYGIYGYDGYFELNAGICAHTLKLPDNLVLTDRSIPTMEFLVAYFHLLAEGLPFNQHTLDLALEQSPNLMTTSLDLMCFGKGSKRKTPGFQSFKLTPQAVAKPITG